AYGEANRWASLLIANHAFGSDVVWSWQMTRQSQIERESPGALHEHYEREGDNHEVVFNSVARLVAKPVQEKSVLRVKSQGDRHCDRNAQRSDARQESDDQTEAAQKLRRDS